MKKFVSGLLICSIVLNVLSLAAAALIALNWRSVVSLYTYIDTTDATFVFPYYYFIQHILELSIAAGMLWVVTGQFKNGDTSILGEILTMVYAIGLTPVISYAGSILHTFIIRNYGAQSLAVNSAVTQSLGFVSFISHMALSLLLVSCGASIVIKNS